MGSAPSQSDNKVHDGKIQSSPHNTLTPTSGQQNIFLSDVKNLSKLSQIIKITPQQKNEYNIPQLQKIIQKAYKDLQSRDPIGKRRYFFQVINFIFDWLKKSMQTGMSLYDAENLVTKDLQKALKNYPIGKIQPITTNIIDKKPQKLPDLIEDLKKNLTKQTFTDRIKQLSLRSKQNSYQFNKQMQLILQKNGGYKFKAGYKNTGTKAYMRILSKILQDFLDGTQGSKQVYTDMNHYFWTPIFIHFNKVIDQNLNKLKINVYDWIRCKCLYKNINDLQLAYDRLIQKYGDSIFRVKNRINLGTRDVLINLKFKNTQYTQIQLALSFDATDSDFNHKLYELTREKLGVAYCCFTLLLNQVGQPQSDIAGIMTPSGYIKRSLLREKNQIGFQRLTLQDAKRQWFYVEKILSKWDSVALKTGTVRGPNYQQRFSTEHYGPEVMETLIIKRKTNQPLANWLNWMN